MTPRYFTAFREASQPCPPADSGRPIATWGAPRAADWLPQLPILLGFFVLLSLWTFSAAAFAKSAGVDAKYIHREGSQTLEQLFRAELADAKADRKSVVVMFTADWCHPCKNVKEFLHDSPIVQKEVKRGRFLFIDVDEWRGPAHQLIAGINPTKLPVLVNVDYEGKAVQSCFGTDLGLISEVAVGQNLARLMAGKAPERPAFLDDATKRRELLVAQARKDKERVGGNPALKVEVRGRKDMGGGQSDWTLHVFIQNHDSRRRWFAIPARLGVPLAEVAQAESVQTLRFNEHVRANMMRIEADPPLWIVPLGGLGSVDLDNLVVRGPSDASEFEVWELNRLEIGGDSPEFDKKVPFNLVVEDAMKVTPMGRRTGAVQVNMPPGKRQTAPLLK